MFSLFVNNNELSVQPGAVQYWRQPTLAVTSDCVAPVSSQCRLRSKLHRLVNGQIELDK